MTVAASITKIRRLCNDVNTQYFSDAQIIRVFAREQQKFCRDTKVQVDVVTLLAPPNIPCCVSRRWEEGYAGMNCITLPYYNSTYGATQPWELEFEYTQKASGGTTHTDGVGVPYKDPQHPLPFFLPDDFYSPCAILWDYKWVESKDMDWLYEHRSDAWVTPGDVVDYFAMARDARKKAFHTHGIPYTVGDGTNEESIVGEALEADEFHVIYNQVPERVTLSTDSVATYLPFVKYIEMTVASKLLAMDTKKKDLMKAEHLKARSQIGRMLVAKVMRKLYANRVFRLGAGATGRGQRPARPRLPDHYPAMEA